MFKINNFSIVPKFVILLLDLGATVTALFIAILIQQNVSLATTNWQHMLNATLLILLVNSLVFTTTKSHTGIVRYTGVQDALRIAIAVGLSSFIILVINTVALGVSSILSMTTLVIVLYTIFSFLFLISYRVLVKYLFAPRNAIDPAEAYRLFRGRDAKIDALMRDRGFPIPKK